jgi:DNA invertase Pin-like site-specific DNA recombinase
MSEVIAFIRVNKYNQEYVSNQIDTIKEYLLNHNLQLTTSIKAEANIPDDEDNILEQLATCKNSSTIIISDLNVLGRTTQNILKILKILLQRDMKIISINQNFELLSSDTISQMILAIISHTLYLEKSLMSLRTKEALFARKLEGVNLGKPKGTIQKSKFDAQKDKIIELLTLGLSIRKISKALGYNNHIGLNNYIKKRGLKEQLNLN